jgi:ADP-L-glycero-D-manno-heptose 6-epimerase
MIVITGAAGFIGSCLAALMNEQGFTDLVLVDDFSFDKKKANYSTKKYNQLIERTNFISWLAINAQEIDFIFHLGARTDTTEFDKEIFETLNVQYSKDVWNACVQFNIPLVYASSAATYGNGELGYDDNHQTIPNLKPLNPYGNSKQEFDCWVLKQTTTPPFWAGLKFFNVYGPNEFHKARMASVIFHSYNQIQATGKVKLFRSHRNEYKDGWQLRDFIYVKDLISVCNFLMKKTAPSGIYNLGTGKARSFYDLATATFKAMHKEVNIEFIDIPSDIRETYQYFTEANMQKLIDAGYIEPFTSLEDGVTDYVTNYLLKNAYY